MASRWLPWLALATCLATYALVIAGGIVRTTGSGDACPDWPRCHGQLVPPLSGHVLVEFSHRLLATLVSVLVLAMVVAAWRWRHRSPVVFWGAVTAVVLIGVQIVLGGITVLSDLSSSLVMAHLATASALLATLVVVTIASFEPAAGQSSAAVLSFRNVAAGAALAVLALMLSGSYVSGTGAGLAFRDWPLFDGRLMPEGGRLAMIHATHRFAALLVGFALAYLVWRGWRTRQISRTFWNGTLFAFALYLIQALVGAANIWTLLQPAASAAHLALAMALWATLVTLATQAHLTALPARRAATETVAAPSVQPSTSTVPARGPL